MSTKLSILFILLLLVACSPASLTPGQEPRDPLIGPQLAEPGVNFNDSDLLNAAFIPDGDVIAVGVGEVLSSLQRVSTGEPGTFIMQSPTGDYLFGWARAVGGQWGFVGVNSTGGPKPISELVGNAANTRTVAEMLKSLERAGWKYVAPDDPSIPLWITTLLQNARTFIQSIGNFNLTPFFIVFSPTLFDLSDGTIDGGPDC